MSLAHGYAKALFESAQDQNVGVGELATLQKSIENFYCAVSSAKNVRVVFFGPLVSLTLKEKILEEIAARLGLTPLATKFVKLVVNAGRLKVLPKILDEFERFRVELSGAVQGELETADEVEEAEVARVRAVFHKRMGKEVQFRVKTNPDLLAGMKITVGGVTYDGTLRSKFQQMRDKFEETAIH